MKQIMQMKTTELRILIYFISYASFRVKNPNWREADQLAIYKDDRGVEPGTYPEQHQLVVRAGFEPGSPHWNPAP